MTRRADNRRSDPDALDEQLRAHAPDLFRSACLILGDVCDAEEVTVGALERAWKFRNALRGGDVDRWLYRILVSGCFSHARRRRPVEPQPAACSTGTGAISAALAELPLRHRVVFVLAFYSGLGEPAIATATASRVTTVRRDLAAGRARVDELMGAHDRVTGHEEDPGRVLTKEAAQ